MDYTACVMILGIMWWVLAGCAIVAFMAWTYTQVMYYKWNAEDRQKDTIIEQVQHTITQTITEVREHVEMEPAETFEETSEITIDNNNS